VDLLKAVLAQATLVQVKVLLAALVAVLTASIMVTTTTTTTTLVDMLRPPQLALLSPPLVRVYKQQDLNSPVLSLLSLYNSQPHQ